MQNQTFKSAKTRKEKRIRKKISFDNLNHQALHKWIRSSAWITFIRYFLFVVCFDFFQWFLVADSMVFIFCFFFRSFQMKLDVNFMFILIVKRFLDIHRLFANRISRIARVWYLVSYDLTVNLNIIHTFKCFRSNWKFGRTQRKKNRRFFSHRFKRYENKRERQSNPH